LRLESSRWLFRQKGRCVIPAPTPVLGRKS
jgi:hypothetical protein